MGDLFKALWMRLTYKRGPYKPGDVVALRYERDKRATLETYLGVDVDYNEDHQLVASELWRTTEGNTVAVGYAWVPVSP